MSARAEEGKEEEGGERPRQTHRRRCSASQRVFSLRPGHIWRAVLPDLDGEASRCRNRVLEREELLSQAGDGRPRRGWRRAGFTAGASFPLNAPASSLFYILAGVEQVPRLLFEPHPSSLPLHSAARRDCPRWSNVKVLVTITNLFKGLHSIIQAYVRTTEGTFGSWFLFLCSSMTPQRGPVFKYCTSEYSYILVGLPSTHTRTVGCSPIFLLGQRRPIQRHLFTTCHGQSSRSSDGE